MRTNFRRYGEKKKIAWDKEKKVYLHEFGHGETTNRNYAWTGTAQQFLNLLELRPEISRFKCIDDGGERALGYMSHQDRMVKIARDRYSHS